MAEKKKPAKKRVKRIEINPKGLLRDVRKRNKELEDALHYGEAPSGKRGI